MTWVVESARAEAIAREVLDRVATLAESPGATLVKRSLQRTVHRVGLSDGSIVIVKEYRVRNRRQRLKGLAFGSKAAAEWAASRRLLAMGVPASHAIALGLPASREGDIEGYLVVEVLPDVMSLGAYVTGGTPVPPPGNQGWHGPPACDALLRELAAFVRRLHDRGVRHGDLHEGNILVRASAPSPAERFLVIDLHRIRLGRPPGARHRARAIAQLLHGLAARVGAERRAAAAAFLDAYGASGPPLGGSAPSLEAVVRAVERRAAERLASRARRCLKNSTQFAVERSAGWRIWHRRDHGADEVLALWERHRASGHSVSQFPEGDATLEVRGYPRRGLVARLFGCAPAVRAYAGAHRAWLEAGGGPRAVAAAECLTGPERGRSFAVFSRGPE